MKQTSRNGPVRPRSLRSISGRFRARLWMTICAAATCGCSSQKRIEPLTIANPFMGQATIAVAPAVNVSGSVDFDPNRFADQMASELGFADRVTVIPVSRVLGAMAVAGRDQVSSPQQAMEIAELVGADAILVFAVTEYDPFDPPRIGITAQLYGATPWHGLGVQAEADETGVRLLAQTQRVFSGANVDVVQEIKGYAALRDADESPFGWRRYVVSQQHFQRYCCYATIRSLLSGDRSAVVATGAGSGR